MIFQRDVIDLNRSTVSDPNITHKIRLSVCNSISIFLEVSEVMWQVIQQIFKPAFYVRKIPQVSYPQ